MRTAHMAVFLMAALGGLILFACGSSDMGTPAPDSDSDTTSDSDSDTADSDSQSDSDDSDSNVPTESRCVTKRQNNDVDITMLNGGQVQVCLIGDTLDGAGVKVDSFTLSQDAHFMIREGEDITMDGYESIGPAVYYEVRAKSGSHAVTASGSMLFSLPFDLGKMTNDLHDSHFRVAMTLDAANHDPNGSTNAPFFLPATAGLLKVDRTRGIVTVQGAYFGTLQVMIPKTIAATQTRHYTYRGLSGASMGACATSMLGFPESARFDMLGPLGGCADNAYLMGLLHDFQFGGFCTYQQIMNKETGEARTPAELDAFLKDTTAECGYCGPQTNPDQWSVPVNKCYMTQPRSIYAKDEHAQGFNHWYYDGNGAHFNRIEEIQLLRDLGYSFGNFTNYNTESPYLAAGLEGQRLSDYLSQVYNQSDMKVGCANLATLMKNNPITGFYDAEYNPEGKYPVIVFCDGTDDRNSGDWDPTNAGARSERVDMLLAVDYNGNGVRDYGEPVIRQFSEPFKDCGLDNLCDPDEPGYDPLTNPDPNGDDYNPYTNPTGTEGNFVWDDDGTRHEDFSDVGIDGVPCPTGATCKYDYGEGNGKFDYNPHVAAALEKGGAIRASKMGATDLDRLNVYIDGGIRDVFNFGLMGDNLAGALTAHSSYKTTVLQDFPAAMTPSPASADAYSYMRVNYADLGHNVEIRYGDYNATDAEVASGDGRHVGYTAQVLYRLTTMLAFTSAHFPKGDFTVVTDYDLSTLTGRGRFYSSSMGRKMVYAFAFPPGYDSHNSRGTGDNPHQCQDRYPVLYILHGYGMDPAQTVTSAVSIMSDVASGNLQKFIMIFPEGECYTPDQCRTDCKNDCKKDTNCYNACLTEYKCDQVKSECVNGTFYLDKVATVADPLGTNAGELGPAPLSHALYDLMDYVDSHFCAREAEDVVVDGATLDGIY